MMAQVTRYATRNSLSAVTGHTTLVGVIGWPVEHSLSPAMHNAAFAALEEDGVYVPFPVIDVAGAVTGFKALGVRGVSVTIPHKQAVMEVALTLFGTARTRGT